MQGSWEALRAVGEVRVDGLCYVLLEVRYIQRQLEYFFPLSALSVSFISPFLSHRLLSLVNKKQKGETADDEKWMETLFQCYLFGDLITVLFKYSHGSFIHHYSALY